MGYLLIDTRHAGQARLQWGTDRLETWQEAGAASALLGVIQAHRDLLAAELQGIIVAAGPGRFSALRVGVLYAHLLARWFRVPLFEATPEDLLDEATRQTCLISVRTGQRMTARLVSPRYDREPNITTPRP